MNLYEEIMILDPDLDENAIQTVVDNVKEKIVKQGGEVLKSENWGDRKLAYELNKREKGIYIVLLFKAPPSTIMELERHSMITDAINKIMVIKLHKKKHIDAVMTSLAKSKGKASAESAPAESLQPQHFAPEGQTPEGQSGV